MRRVNYNTRFEKCQILFDYFFGFLYNIFEIFLNYGDCMKRLVVIAILLGLILSGCTEEPPISRDIFAMDTLINIRIWGEYATLDSVCNMIYQLDSLLNAEDEGSDIYQLNNNGFLVVKSDTERVLSEAIRYSEETNGTFDPTIYPLVSAWKNAQLSPPDAEELSDLLPFVGTEHISIHGDAVSLSENAALDLGAIGKGFAAQECIDYLRNCKVECAIVTLGGNVQTLGSKPDGSEWAIGIADPENPNQSIGVLRFEGSLALVTSGGYQRYYEIDGIKYHHILDPKTGYPAENELASVTILAQNGTLADAFSTALFVMGLEDASAFWRDRNDFEAVFILKDGSIIATDGAASLLTDCEFTVIYR